MISRLRYVFVFGLLLGAASGVRAFEASDTQTNSSAMLFLDRAKIALTGVLERCKTDPRLRALAQHNIKEWRRHDEGHLRVTSEQISVQIEVGPQRPGAPSATNRYVRFTTQVPLTRLVIDTTMLPEEGAEYPRSLPPDVSEEKSRWPDIRLQSYLKESFTKQGISLQRVK